MKQKILQVIFGVVLILVVWNASLIGYGIAQANGQLSIIWGARPVDEALADPAFPDSLKARLRLITLIRKYAIDSLGLKDTENYRTVYDQEGKELMWVVTACEPFQLKAREWQFPVVGTVPYKGYFHEDLAMEERNSLEKDGFDVSIRNPDGWSTLGWFTDPILTGMLDRSDGDLASLIIHEMVHSTLWVKDSVDFNENIASFIADTAAYEFLAVHFGKSSKEYQTYLHEDQDYRLVSKHMLRATKGLDSLYQAIRETEPIELKKNLKQNYIRRAVFSIDTLPLHRERNAKKRFAKHLPNNTYFMGFRHYQSKVEHFKKEMNARFPGDLKGYLHFLALRYPV